MAGQGARCLPFQFESRSRWFSEHSECSAFLARHRGDRVAESWTHADGVVGQFEFDPGTKAGLALAPNCTQFIVCEAKIFSLLSTGTTNAPNFHQAARNVGCMAETLRRASRPVGSYSSLGFFVLAPESQVAGGVFASQLTKRALRVELMIELKCTELSRSIAA